MAVQDFLSTGFHYLLAAAAIILCMLALNTLLHALKVRTETATAYTLILPWLLGFLIWTAFP
ncbi:MAG: ABC transporter permease, partial [Kiritimatiellota bacterium]|nr:ABC transporter permease [Kiritimatiellota bacterium]